MAEDDLAEEMDNMNEELDLDSDSDGDLEVVMQEALDAVEKASNGLTSRATDRPAATGDPRALEESEDIERLQEEIAELKDRGARTLADFDNFRKRIDRERREERQYAAWDVLGELLAVVDNLERALESDGRAEDLKTGVELIHRQLRNLMEKVGVRRVESLGLEFDPRFHEAVTRHEDPQVEAPTVCEELQAGYLMHDRLLRPSVVKVAMPPANDSSAEPSSVERAVEED